MIFKMGCFHDPEFVMEIDGTKYYGSDCRGAKNFLGDAMINFTKVSDLPQKIIPELREYMDLPTYSEIMIPWPDFGLPGVQINFWEALHEYILEQGWKDVCFHCQAGHGRTGTALATMLIALDHKTPLEALWHVRTKYCEHAIETNGQCDYLVQVDGFYNERECNDVLLGSQTLFSADVKEAENEFQYGFVDDDDEKK